MSEPRWYCAQGEQAVGPFNLTQLRQMVMARKLGPADYVCREGESEWVAASTIAGLFASPPPIPGESRQLVRCVKCGAGLPEGTATCPRCGGRLHPDQAGTSDNTAAPAPDKHSFTGMLVVQTLANWFGAGLLTSAAVDLICTGINYFVGATTAACGAVALGVLAPLQVPDKWYMLRWTNYVLNRVAVVGPIVGFLVARLLLGLFWGAVFPAADKATAEQLVRQEQLWNLILRSAVLLGLLTALVVHLARTWGRVRHVDLPTDLKGWD